MDLIHTRYTPIFFSLPLKDWMLFNLRVAVGRDNPNSWSQIWGVAVWFLWLWRNKEVFSDDFHKPVDPVGAILRSWKLFCPSPELVLQPNTVCMSKWMAPPSGWVKLNTDGRLWQMVGKQDVGE